MSVKKIGSSLEARVRKARKIGRQAQEHAAVIQANPALERSTRSRAVYKVKAEALDRVMEALAAR